ncbi:KN motif and ankyrin repeat domain-containing protein 2 [Guaruba guarouba]
MVGMCGDPGWDVRGSRLGCAGIAVGKSGGAASLWGGRGCAAGAGDRCRCHGAAVGRRRSGSGAPGAAPGDARYTLETAYGYRLDLGFLGYVEAIEQGLTLRRVPGKRRLHRASWAGGARDPEPRARPRPGAAEEEPGTGPAALRGVREQMAAALGRLRELEEEVRALPALRRRLERLQEEKRQLLERLRSHRGCGCGRGDGDEEGGGAGSDPGVSGIGSGITRSIPDTGIGSGITRSIPDTGIGSGITRSIPDTGISSGITRSIPDTGISSSISGISSGISGISSGISGIGSGITRSIPDTGISSSISRSIPDTGIGSGITGISSGISGSIPDTGISSGISGSIPDTGISSSISGSIPDTQIGSSITGSSGGTGIGSGATSSSTSIGISAGITRSIAGTRIGSGIISSTTSISSSSIADARISPGSSTSTGISSGITGSFPDTGISSGSITGTGLSPGQAPALPRGRRSVAVGTDGAAVLPGRVAELEQRLRRALEELREARARLGQQAPGDSNGAKGDGDPPGGGSSSSSDDSEYHEAEEGHPQAPAVPPRDIV